MMHSRRGCIDAEEFHLLRQGSHSVLQLADGGLHGRKKNKFKTSIKQDIKLTSCPLKASLCQLPSSDLIVDISPLNSRINSWCIDADCWEWNWKKLVVKISLMWRSIIGVNAEVKIFAKWPEILGRRRSFSISTGKPWANTYLSK